MGRSPAAPAREVSVATDGMRILVSFKVTPDYEALPQESWAAPAALGKSGAGADGAESAVGAPETRYVRRVLNCSVSTSLVTGKQSSTS